MGFKKGDIVVCINDKPSSYLMYGKKYMVTNNAITNGYIFIDSTNIVAFNSNMFVSLEKYRTMKINRIKNNIKNYEN